MLKLHVIEVLLENYQQIDSAKEYHIELSIKSKYEKISDLQSAINYFTKSTETISYA